MWRSSCTSCARRLGQTWRGAWPLGLRVWALAPRPLLCYGPCHTPLMAFYCTKELTWVIMTLACTLGRNVWGSSHSFSSGTWRV